MTEQGTDRYGAEYKRTDNDFHVRYLEQDNCICSVCHGTGAKIEIRYVVRNYESERVKKKICKNLQAHERSLWICPKCIDNFKQKLSVINERNLTQPKPCQYCGAEMRDAADTAKDIVHEAIDNSVWSNTVDTAKMHKVVDDKYAEMMEDEG